MSFDEIFDLTAGVYFDFYNNSSLLVLTTFSPDHSSVSTVNVLN